MSAIPVLGQQARTLANASGKNWLPPISAIASTRRW